MRFVNPRSGLEQFKRTQQKSHSFGPRKYILSRFKKLKSIVMSKLTKHFKIFTYFEIKTVILVKAKLYLFYRHNLKRSGRSDMHMLHGGCPVIVGKLIF